MIRFNPDREGNKPKPEPKIGDNPEQTQTKPEPTWTFAVEYHPV